FFRCCLPPRTLHSFPTRRSSDLLRFLSGGDMQIGWFTTVLALGLQNRVVGIVPAVKPADLGAAMNRPVVLDADVLHRPLLIVQRSEEHTSELQSRGHLVCRLLLE